MVGTNMQWVIFVNEFDAEAGSSSNSSNFIFQQIYNAHLLTKHNICNIIHWWLSGKCKAHLADNQYPGKPGVGLLKLHSLISP